MIRALFTRRFSPLGASALTPGNVPRVRQAETFFDHQAELNVTFQHPITRFFTTTQPTSLTASITRQSSPFRNSGKNDPPTFEDAYYSPYQPKRQWPPDMSKLSPKHQFRLERKYRRRAALKYARPKLMKATKIGQWVVIGCESVENRECA